MPTLLLRPALLAALLLSGCAATQGLRPFASDGCSLFPDRAPLGKTDWCGCCLAHDLAYWKGGTEEERLQADRQLRDCVVAKTGDKALAETMLAGVRAGGAPQLGTPFRWGYGWPRGRGYEALSEAEQLKAAEMEGSYRAGKAQACGRSPE
ncbi:FAD-binding oxidoreductase [Solimonas sp. K1W22B-7]|uniref:FAD-binding oxidoreductase n=1 Tax=Solimonas sp. K1W22B-7 TaxID=2303331 RepID=UPI000E3322B5|nr:FAD-binding oxidoreductase [Solimonas sp. K1W22B-7]AXQ27953.1 FAD-binding oxidoreductase [Solimonas sp. K1W22B-7]